jgi:Cu(I)/Ag(I) efflux system protein CusF
MKKLTLAAALALSLASPSLVFAQATPMVPGKVTKVDEAGQKVTIDHGPIKNLDMDAMTMAWRVQDPAMLKGLKAGDKVQFSADRVNGSLTVTKIQKGK